MKCVCLETDARKCIVKRWLFRGWDKPPESRECTCICHQGAATKEGA